eukprot:16434612-Heterocapsa_arctica.AAC.2
MGALFEVIELIVVGTLWGAGSRGGLEAKLCDGCPPEVVPSGLKALAGWSTWEPATDGCVGPGTSCVGGRGFGRSIRVEGGISLVHS